MKKIIERIRKYGVCRLSRETGISKYTIYNWTIREKEPSKRLLRKVLNKAPQLGNENEMDMGE